MSARKITEGIYSVGAIDWDRRLFDELIPLPDGTSYNSYLIIGKDKTALLDGVDPTLFHELKANIEQTGTKKIDYIVSHHSEQDHSGMIPELLKMFPNAKLVTTEKCKAMLQLHIGLPEDRCVVMQPNQTLDLGGRTLEFIPMPWVHWPETLVTYDKEDKILFSCDLFGSHMASSDLFIKKENEGEAYRSAKRYYAEIMMPFRTAIQGHLQTLKKYDIEMICPSHGYVYDKPSFIIDAYADWTSDKVKNEVVLAHVTMHGSTQILTERLISALIDNGVKVVPYELSRSDIGDIAMSTVDAATIVIGCPAVLAGPHPLAANIAFLANALRPKTRFVSIIGSFGWGSKMIESLTAMMSNLKAEVLPPVVVKGLPREEELKKIDELAKTIAERHKTAGLM